jgi:hypothetical protein
MFPAGQGNSPGAFHLKRGANPVRYILQIPGGLWALVGIGNIVTMPWLDSTNGMLTLGMIINFVLFILPGLMVFGIGAAIGRKPS